MDEPLFINFGGEERLEGNMRNENRKAVLTRGEQVWVQFKVTELRPAARPAKTRGYTPTGDADPNNSTVFLKAEAGLVEIRR